MLAVGFGNFIHSTGSAVIGYQNTVWMKNSFAIGQGNEVGQDFSSLTNNTGSVAIGTDNHVAGSDSLVIGVANSANYVLNYEDDEGAKRSLIVGNWNMSEGHNSVIVGENNSIGSSYSYALIPAHNTAVFGSGLISKYDNCTIVGKNNAAVFTPYNQSPPLFVVGNGVSTSTRADALVIKANGDMKLQGNIDASGIVTCSPGGNIPMFTGN